MSEISHLLSDVLGGHRLTVAEAEGLLKCKDRNILQIAVAADEMREHRAGKYRYLREKPEPSCDQYL